MRCASLVTVFVVVGLLGVGCKGDHGRGVRLVTTSQRVAGFVADAAGIGWLEAASREGKSAVVMHRSVDGRTIKVVNTKAAFGLAMDESYLYWISDQRVERAARGSSTVELVSESEGPSGSPVVDDRFVYWVSQGDFYRAPKGGGSAEEIPAPDPEMDLLLDVIVVDGVVVVGAERLEPKTSTAPASWRVALWAIAQSGEARPIATSPGRFIALVGGGGRLAWTTSDDDHLAGKTSSYVASMAAGAATALEAVTGVVLAVDADSVYWRGPRGAVSVTDARGTRRFSDGVDDLIIVGERCYAVFQLRGDSAEIRSMPR